MFTETLRHHEALRLRRLDIVKYMISKRCNPDVEDCNASTPLFEAIEKGDFNVVNDLLAYGANPNHMNYHKMTPLLVALDSHNIDILNALDNAGMTVTHAKEVRYDPFVYAIKYCPVAIVKCLVELGLPVNTDPIPRLWMSNLDIAIEYGRTATALFLIESRGNVKTLAPLYLHICALFSL